MSLVKHKKGSKRLKKIAFRLISPFIPFILIIGLLFFSICSIIDAVFIQEVQADTFSMPEAEQELRTKCIEKAEYLNTCHNYKDNELTKYLLDIDNREIDKEIQWSHLYSIMAFHNMTNNTDIDEKLLNKVSKSFESTFKYEKMSVKIETTTKDENGNETISTTEETAYLLVESDTIMGHYKYHYKDSTIQNGNTKTIKKVFDSEELIGEEYSRLKKYLKNTLHIRDSDIDKDVQIVIQAANGYYDGKENLDWLQQNSSSYIVVDGKGLVPTGMFTWPIPGYTTITSHFRYENTSNNWSI